MNKGKFVLISFIVFLFLAGAASAQNDILPNPGLTPTSPFYFFDKLGETLREFFTFNPESKARLQIAFAAERVAEIKVILETKGVEARGLEVAQSRLQTNLAKAAAIVAKKKSKGEDVSTLAKELDDELETPKSALAQSFKEQKQALEAKEDELKAQLKAAHRAGDTAKEEALAQELGKVKAQKELLELKKENIEDELEAEEEKLEKEMEIHEKALEDLEKKQSKKEEAEEAIKEAEEEKQEVLDEAKKEEVELPPTAFTKFDRLLSQAKELFAKENYQGAKQLAEQAENALEDIDKELEKPEKGKEQREERIKEEQEKTKEKLKEEPKKIEIETLEIKVRAVPLSKIREINIVNGGFEPSKIEVEKGIIVRWFNRSDRESWPASSVHPSHNVYPQKGGCIGSAFDACRGIKPNEAYEFIFNISGTWGYHDHLNPGAQGVVVVK